MSIKFNSLSKAIAIAIGATVTASSAIAQTQIANSEIEEIIVRGANVYRDRTDDVNPTLLFNLDFFQRFEPLTVGEMLKRTPGVTFTSDVLEYDAVQLRGMNAEYTEVLINGKSIPGQGADRTFFVDRIPSELVESIEIIRSPAADMNSAGVAGTLNVILKDGAQLEGVTTRIGTTYYGDDDKEFRQTGSVAVAHAGDSYDFWLGVNYQERRNPKKKTEKYFDDGELEGFAFEDDARDGEDTSINGSLGIQVGEGEFRFNGFYVDTDRQENEVVEEFEGSEVNADTGDLIELATQEEQIDQSSWGFDGTYTTMVGDNELSVSAGFSHFDEDTVNFETEEEFDGGVSQGVEDDSEILDIEDNGYSVDSSYKMPLGDNELKVGIAYSRNEREGLQAGILFDIEAEIEETRIAPYAKLTVNVSDELRLEGGFRFDTYERDVTSEDGSGSQEGEELLPSLSLRWDLDSERRFTASVARTLRRPEFDLVTPFEEEDEPDDGNVVVGNTALDSELAWGLDVGFEHRLPGSGIVGVNFFYRDVEDVIEITDTGTPTSTDEGNGTLFVPLNIGDGTARGIEFDLSTPLSFMGLDNTGFYMNYAWLDSEITDPFTGDKRTFRNQPDFVYNISLTQDLPGFGGAGISYQQRGDSLETEFEEYVITEYDANLELFVEWNISDNSVLRFSGTNLLDQEKLEFIRDYGEPVNEIRIEDSSPTYTLTWRAAY